ncbi:MAG: cell wall hydrolase [Limnochordia bacterium]|nr:cell wall hydrolase [Limnochordia bacterium]MDD4518388.1 cell wall hydrolase [Limnochordia bacterium]
MYEARVMGSVRDSISGKPLIQPVQFQVGEQIVEVEEGFFDFELAFGTHRVFIAADGFKDYENSVLLFRPLETLYYSLEPCETGWLIRLVYAEAGGESYLGKVGVAASVLNRVKSPSYPGDIVGVIFQRVAGYVQYSPVADGRLYLYPGPFDPASEKKAYLECVDAVKEALEGADPTDGAVGFYNYHTVSYNNWVRKQPTTVDIGNHRFYRERS